MTSDAQALEIDGCYNFRDVGGILTGDGGMIRAGRLFRSDVPTRLTGEDRTTLARAGLRTVVDLRTVDEVEHYGVGGWSGEDPRRVHIELAPEEALPTDAEIEEWTTPQRVADHYLRVLDQGDAAFGAVLDHFADPDHYPALVHCMSGRDRTGIVVGLLLTVAGVDEADVLVDYQRTETGLRRQLEEVLRGRATDRDRDRAMDTGGDTDTAEFIRYAHTIVDTAPANLALFLAGVRDRFGSAHGYVAHLGRERQAAGIREALRSPVTP